MLNLSARKFFLSKREYSQTCVFFLPATVWWSSSHEMYVLKLVRPKRLDYDTFDSAILPGSGYRNYLKFYPQLLRTLLQSLNTALEIQDYHLLNT